MSNIYICFSTKEEKDEFILDFLNLKPMLNGSDNIRRSNKEKLFIQKGIRDLITNVESGFFRRLYRHYPGGHIPDNIDTSIPWTFPGLFAQGIRSIFVQSSYMNRPGIWLGIDLRSTSVGKIKRHWILENVPKSKIGLNVPLPESYILKQKLEIIRQIISAKNPCPHAEKALEYLLEIKEKQPSMFKGNNVFLWEDMARIFDSMDLLEKAVFCFETQAELMPGCSNPYLNLGVLYKGRGFLGRAIDAYNKGLDVNPNDEYIFYNLSSLFMQNGIYDIAMKRVNSAILENPSRGLNYYLKGDIHFNRHEYDSAIISYEWALTLFDGQWKYSSNECLQKLAVSYERIGNKEQATKLRSQVDGGRDNQPWGTVLKMLDAAVELYTMQYGEPPVWTVVTEEIYNSLFAYATEAFGDIPEDLEGIEFAGNMVFICRSSSVQLFLFDALIPDMTLPKGLQEYLEPKRYEDKD